MENKFDRNVDTVTRRAFQATPVCIVIGAFVGSFIGFPSDPFGFSGLVVGGIIGALGPMFVVLAALLVDICFNPRWRS